MNTNIFHCFINIEEIQLLEPVAVFSYGKYYPSVSVYLKGREKEVGITGTTSFDTSDKAFKAAQAEIQCFLQEEG